MAGTKTKDFLNEQITTYLSENPDAVSKLLDAAGEFKTNNQQTAGSVAAVKDLAGLSQNTAGNQTPQETAPAPSYRYDAANDPVYQQALKNQQQVQAQAPVYGATYDQQIKDMYEQVMNQKPFQYDLNGDALWQQYKDQYTTQGKLAMMDTMGQTAALTGGYGSSYAQNAGQQAYQGYLQQLNDRVPELYQLALSKYNNDQAALKDQFSVTAQMQADEYGKYQDAVSQHNLALDRAQGAVDTAYDRGYNAWATEEQLRRQDEETSYNRQQSEYDKLANLIASTGYSPSEEELTAAGMTGTQATAYAKVYKDSKKTSTRSSGSSKNTVDTSEIQYKKMGYSNYNDMYNSLTNTYKNEGTEELLWILNQHVNNGYMSESTANELAAKIIPDDEEKSENTTTVMSREDWKRRTGSYVGYEEYLSQRGVSLA